MIEEFDPYHKWLGIPPKDQPPNHYRLLGVALFEADPEVIEAAFYRQIAYVRTYQIGPHADLSQKLLNELAAAKVCLLDPTKRAFYEEELRQQLGAGAAAESAAGPSPVPPPVTPEHTAEPPVPPAAPVVSAGALKHPKPKHRQKPLWPVYAALGAGALLVLLLLALLVPGPGSDEVLREDQQAPHTNDPAAVADVAPSTSSASTAAASPVPSPTQPQVRDEVASSSASEQPPLPPSRTSSGSHADAAARSETSGDNATPAGSQPSGDGVTGQSPLAPRLPVPPGARLMLTFEQNTLFSNEGKTAIRDVSGNGHVAILSAGQIVPGKIGSALSLDDGERIGITGNYPSGKARRTVAAWLRAHPKGIARGFQGVAYYGPGRIEGRFGVATVKGKWSFYGWGTGHDLSTPVPVDTEWHHHAVAYDGKNILYYYDAQLVLKTLPRSRRPLNTGAAPAYLGSPQASFAGWIDEFAIFDRVLEPQEIFTLFRMGELEQPLQP